MNDNHCNIDSLATLFSILLILHFNSRYVCWSAYLIKRHPKLASALGNDLEGNGLDYTAKIPLDQKLYFQYFVQDDIEDGTLMDTKVPVKEVIIYDRETFER